MRTLIRALLFAAVLLGLPAPALAQGNGCVGPKLPANTVLGRLGAGQAGSCQAIPFAVLAAQLSSMSGPVTSTNNGLPIWNGTTGSVLKDGAGQTIAGNYTWGGNQTLTNNQNGTAGWTVTNNSTGTGAAVLTNYSNSSNTASFGIEGTGFTIIPYLQNMAVINAGSGASGIVLNNVGANPVIFGVSSTEVGRFASTQFNSLKPVVITANGITNFNSDLISTLLTVNLNAAAPQPWVNLVGEQWAVQVTGKDGQATNIGIDSFGTGNTAAFSVFDCRRADGTAATPTALKSGDLICVLGAIGRAATIWSAGAAQYRAYAAQDWTDTANGSRVDILTTPNGSPATGNVRPVVRFDQDATTILFGKAVIGGQTLASGGSSTPVLDINGSAAATNFAGGTNAPMLRLLAADGNATALAFQNYGLQNQFLSFIALGTAASPTAVTSGTVMFNVGAIPYDGSAYGNAGITSTAAIQYRTAELQAPGAHGSLIALSTTPTGTTARADALLVQPSGGISVGTTTDPGIGAILANTLIKATTTVEATTGYRINGAAGLTQTCTVNQAKTLIFTLGILTGGTCNS